MTAPDGREWKVGRQWLPRRLRVRRPDLDWFDPSGGLDDAGGLLLLLAVFAAVLLVVFVVFPVVVLALELLLLIFLLLLGVAGRVLFGRPWHVLARTEGAAYRWPVKGWRESGERVDQVAGTLASGSVPGGAELLKH